MPVSVLLPHVYREKKDPLDLLAQGLKVAQEIYGLKVDMEKMDDYRSSQDLAKRVREGDPQATEQSRRESQSKNLITDAQAAQLFGKQKIHEKKPEGVDTLEIQTMNGTRYIEQDVDPTKKDAWTTKDFANAVERGFGVNSSDASGGLKVKGDDGQDYWLTGPQKKAKEEKAQQGRPQAYEDSNGRARIGNWDGKTVIKDEENDAFAVTKKEKPTVRKPWEGGISTEDKKSIAQEVTRWRNESEIVKGVDVIGMARGGLELANGPANASSHSTLASMMNKYAWDYSAPTETQLKGSGGQSYVDVFNKAINKRFNENSPSFSGKDLKNITGVIEITYDNVKDRINRSAENRAELLASQSNGITKDQWLKLLNPDGVIGEENFKYYKRGQQQSDGFKSGGPAGLSYGDSAKPVEPEVRFSPQKDYPEYLRKQKQYNSDMEKYNSPEAKMKRYLSK